MKREEFVFAIGYQGSAAMVDQTARKRFAKYSTQQLAEEGMFRAAFCSALYNDDNAEMRAFQELFKAASGQDDVSVDRLKRLFGVKAVPDNVTKVIYV